MTTNLTPDDASIDQKNTWSSGDSVAATHVVMPRLLSIEEVSAHTGIAVATLHTWRSLGKGPQAGKLGKRLRYRADLLQHWIEEEMARG
ncbi:helix-turn-helix domain-containing protein [Microbacterium capsulatum]|uniref:Helix-turn-helix domain-containing protein n=1 Tax=Microbacterium capsulatum TaxID=3041921 RepID=A0ABU0XFZ2_9MICO|nr:helix-turn-helix domain-containing protein [Microbacterium sp. ASV81]MDQ4214043.1 helix-turn-helix domain-containing protein [Microbacterium sp. ASV81]